MAQRGRETYSVSYTRSYSPNLTDNNRTARVIQNGAGQDTTGKRWDWSHVREALRDPQFYFSFLNTLLANIPNG